MGLVQLPDGRWGHDDEPSHCINGHKLFPGRVRIAYEHQKGRTYTCEVCGAETCRNPHGRYIFKAE